MKVINKTTIIFILLLVGLSPVLNASAQTLTGTVYSRPSDKPTIDGYLNDPEWSNGITQEFEMHNHFNASDIIDLEVVSIYNEPNHLYFGFSFIDDNYVGSEIFVIFLKVNNSANLVQFNTPLIPYLTNGNDAKAMWISNGTEDCYTEFNDFNAYFDFNHGGDNNFESTTHIDSNDLVTIELDMLFHTLDIPEAHDIEITVGDKIEIFFWYLDNTGYYSGYLFNSTEYEYGILDVGGLPPTNDLGFTTSALLLSIVSVNLMVIFIAKKMKK